MKLVGHKSWSLKCVTAIYVQPGYLAERGKWDLGLYWSAGELILGRGQEGG